MFNDFKRPTDKLKPTPGTDSVRKAKDNIAQLTDAMEQQGPKTEFAHLGWDTDAQYDKSSNTILVAEDYGSVMEKEPALMEPLLAHERVHAAYQSDDPVDEASLQAYVDEEMAAYQAEYDAWQRVKDQYTSPEGRAALDPAGKELVSRYEFKMDRIEQSGWENYRAQLEQEYRGRIEVKR